MKFFKLKQIVTTAGLILFSSIAFATNPDSGGDVTDITDLTGFTTSFLGNASLIVKMTIIIATLAGLILIVKGLVHLKQNYTGTGQEKHLSKGIASLGFGTALLLTVPLSHAFVASFSQNTDYDTGTGSGIQFVAPKT